MKMVEDWTIDGSDGEPILGTVHLPDDEPVGVMIICHGFKGYKDYGFFPLLAHTAAQRGLIAHRFNFSHSGMTRNIDTFERPDLFEKDTWGKQIHDLNSVAVAIEDGRLAGAGLPTVWFGHSRGGVTVFLAAPLGDPAGIVSAAAPHQCCSWDETIREAIRHQGYIDSPSGRTGQNLRVGKAWLDEIESDPQTFDPVNAIERINCPVLIVHGSGDQTVSVESARALAVANENSTVRIVEGASHTFNATNPLALDAAIAEQTRELIESACDFACSCCDSA